MSEQTAIIRNVHIGADDRGRASLWFDVYISESSAALQVIDWARAGELLAKSGYQANQLEGKPCVVDVDGQIIQFVRMWSRR